MQRIIFAAFIASIILMAWGSVYWLGFPMSIHRIKAAPDEHQTLSMLARELPSSGVYVLPFPPKDLSDEAFRDDYRDGPIAHIFYKGQGEEFINDKLLLASWLQAFINALLIALLVAMVHRGLPTYAKRWLFICICGLFASLASESLYPIWWHHQWKFHLSIMLQQFLGWALAGSVIAAIVKKP